MLYMPHASMMQIVWYLHQLYCSCRCQDVKRNLATSIINKLAEVAYAGRSLHHWLQLHLYSGFLFPPFRDPPLITYSTARTAEAMERSSFAVAKALFAMKDRNASAAKSRRAHSTCFCRIDVGAVNTIPEPCAGSLAFTCERCSMPVMHFEGQQSYLQQSFAHLSPSTAQSLLVHCDARPTCAAAGWCRLGFGGSSNQCRLVHCLGRSLVAPVGVDTWMPAHREPDISQQILWSVELHQSAPRSSAHLILLRTSLGPSVCPCCTGCTRRY
jgi:hypothetical protein